MSQTVDTSATYVIVRSGTSTTYTVWQRDDSSSSLFTQVSTSPTASFPSTTHLSAVGGYLLSYTPPTGTDPKVGYTLLAFDPTGADPLNGPTTQEGSWGQKEKFSGFYDHYTWDPSDTDIVQLIGMTGYVLQYMPTAPRATYRLWNFDPAPTAPNSGADPLPNPITPSDAFSLIGKGSRLLPMGDTVLEWIPETCLYRVWSFDPQAMTPLAMPVLTAGTWSTIDDTHELLALGDQILDWVPSDRSFRLWDYDPTQTQPLIGPVMTGKLPSAFTEDSVVTAIQLPVAVDSTRAAIPGSMDFMRKEIEHVVVYMLESRSFDSVVGWLYEADEKGLNWINGAPPFECTSTSYHNEGNGKTWNVYPFQDGKLSKDYDLTAPVIDPFHGTPDSIHQQYSSGYDGYFNRLTPDMGGFVANNASGEVMVTLTPTQLPVLNGLAGSFAICDAWFSALPGGTDSNRAMALTGSAFNITTTYEGGSEYANFPDRPHRQSVWHALWTQGISDWKIYWSVEWQSEVFTYHLYLKGQIPTVDAQVTEYVQPIVKFYADCKNGTLPKFSFLEPVWIAPAGSTSYHPGGDLVPPEKALNQIYQAIANGPGWAKTALVLTFSKGGGMYDHVPPRRTVNPWPADVNDGFAFDVLGPRVPTLVVSPLVKPNTVFRASGATPYSAMSTVATIMDWFGVPRARWGMGDRIQQVPTFEEVFQLSTPRTDKPSFPNPYDKSNPTDCE